MDYISPDVIANDALLTVPNAGLDTFAILMSRPFNLWNSVVSGRLESRFRISQEITYNNFPLRQLSLDEKAALQTCAQGILDARSEFPDSSLADLYNPLSMPEKLQQAHNANDKAVSSIFNLKNSSSDEGVLSQLFTAYSEMTAGLLQHEAVTVRKERKKRS
jgi:hypothetical protein